MKAPRPAQQPRTPPDDGIVRVGCERRRGGSVTIVYGLLERELDAVAADLKKRCGTGGGCSVNRTRTRPLNFGCSIRLTTAR